MLFFCKEEEKINQCHSKQQKGHNKELINPPCQKQTFAAARQSIHESKASAPKIRSFFFFFFFFSFLGTISHHKPTLSLTWGSGDFISPSIINAAKASGCSFI
jgi:hypothetical protein